MTKRTGLISEIWREGKMKAEYKRDINHNYLIFEDEKGIDRSSYQVRMLLGNVIPSILRCHLQNLDGKNFYSYEITSRQSVASYYEGRKFHGEDIRMLLEGFLRVMEELAEYLMNPEQLLIKPEYIYLDIESGTVFFCCLPEQGGEVQTQLREFIEYMLPKLDHEDQEAVFLGYGIYRRVLEPGFQLEMIKEAVYHSEQKGAVRAADTGEEDAAEKEAAVLPESEEKGKESLPDMPVYAVSSAEKHSGWWWAAGCIAAAAAMLGLLGAGAAGILPWLPAEFVIGGGIAAFGVGGFAGWITGKRKKKQETSAVWGKKEEKGQKISLPSGEQRTDSPDRKRKAAEESEMAIYPDNKNTSYAEIKYTEIKNPEEERAVYGETVALCEGGRSGPATLVSREPGELATIYLEQELTVVGKLANAADAVIPIPTVSRVHARIRKKDGEYYLADLNSRNGTTVNGQILKNGEEYQLQDEDEVDFAQARYIFLK